MATGVQPPTIRARRWHAVVAASIGNALEWFDFAAFGFFAVTMGKLFFPAGSETTSLLIAFATFGVTFFMRPLGALVLGHYADRHGRKAALTLVTTAMMAATAVLAAAPTYESVGLAAPILVVTARLVQGFSAGGEFGSATAFLAEQNPARRGFFSSWQFASQGLTTVLAAGFGAALATMLTRDQIDAWGWRIPFIFGLLIGPVAYYIRTRLHETDEFHATRTSEAPVRETLEHGKLRLLLGLGLIVLTTVTTYTVLFLPTYAIRQLGLSTSNSFLAGMATGTLQFALVPLVGSFSDRHGRIPIAAVSAAALFVAVYPLFLWLAAAPTLQTLLIVQCCIGILIAGYMGPIPALMSELFPVRVRTTGLSVSYSLGVAVFGGFAPFINAWLIDATGSKLAPSFYLMGAAAISFATLMAIRKAPRLAGE